jgi:hypothetical protein
MSYDWEKIFSKKTNKELYNIYSGKTDFPKDVRSIAAKELEKRGFDFNNIEHSMAGWKLTQLYDLQKDELEKISNFLGIKEYLLMTLTLLVMLHIKIFSGDDPVVYSWFYIFGPVAFVGLFGFIDWSKKEKARKRFDKRTLEIEKIKSELSSKGLLSKESYVAEDLSREINKRIESQKRTIKFMKIMAIITFIYFILQGLI